jgi:putative transposase
MNESALNGTNRRKQYTTDLTDYQWEFVKGELPRNTRGAPTRVNLREVVNAIFYLVRNACAWRDLPEGFPPRSTVNYYFNKWQRDGTWQRIVDALRRRVRSDAGREPAPSAACVDSQSAKVVAEAGEDVGTDGGKKVKGRKRHILVDSMGLLLAVVVTAANVSDAEGAKLLFAQLSRTEYPDLQVVFADNAYDRDLLHDYMADHCWFRLEISNKPEGVKGFVVIRIRWVVERTFAWGLRYRRLARDYEHTAESSAAVVRVAMIHLMLQRLRHVIPMMPPGHDRPKAA